MIALLIITDLALVATLIAVFVYRRRWKAALTALRIAHFCNTIETKRADMWKGVVEEAVARAGQGVGRGVVN